MNRYGRLAQSHWQAHAPARFEALEDPAAYFETLGETAAAQIADTSAQLEQQIPADLPYLERVARLRAVQKRAEEMVLTELVYSVEPETIDLAEELEQMLGDLPSPAMIEDSLRRLDEEAEEEAERENRAAPSFSEEQQVRHDQLTTLLPLVRLAQEPEEMSEAELSDRILALRPFWNRETRSLAAPQ